MTTGSSWAEAVGAIGLDKHAKLRPVIPRAPGDGWYQQVTRKPAEWERPEHFADDLERFEWERVRHRFFKDRRGGIWKASNGELVWGPPIPPWAMVIETVGALEGFKRANEAGYWPGMEALKRLGGIKKPKAWQRGKITMLANKRPEIIGCIVRHPHASIEGCWKHCRFYDLDKLHPVLLEAEIVEQEEEEGSRGA